jgi:AraC family L-rhamnose operon transcriptional activator RhaR/AraC family L-rhamnose operon regulatory protein RhaS
MKADKSKWYCKEVFSDNPYDYVIGFTETIFSHGIHIHDFFELNIVLSGSAIHRFNANDFRIHIGDVYIIPPRVPHGYLETKDLKVFHILVHNLFLDKYSAELANFFSYYMLFTIEPLLNEGSSESYLLQLDKDQFDEIKYFLSKLEHFYLKFDTQSCIIRDTLGLLVILRLCQFYQEKTIDGFDLSNIDRAYIEGVRYMFNNYNKKITVNQLAELVHLSKNAFTIKFKKMFNETPGEFLISYRLTKAKNLIQYTDWPLSTIAEQTGFYDVSHFVKTFKAREGITPDDYRRNCNN